MNDFNPTPDTSDIEITAAIQGKTILRCEAPDRHGDDFLVFHFTDGTSLHIRYDYIYEWEVIDDGRNNAMDN